MHIKHEMKLLKQALLIAVIAFTHLPCAAQKKIAYEFPKEMLPEVKQEFIKQCDKGRILYDMNCAKCHSTFVKKKEIIPDFSPDQLKGYELRVSNAQHEADMPDTKVTAEELGEIMIFLTYKKKNTK